MMESKCVNIDYLEVVRNNQGFLEQIQIPIERKYMSVIDTLNEMSTNEGQSLLSMQDYFNREFNSSVKSYNFCHPNRYWSSYVPEAAFPKIYTRSEYNEVINNERKDIRKELLYQNRHKLSKCKNDPVLYAESLKQIETKVEEKVAMFRRRCKYNFYSEAERFINADSFYDALSTAKTSEENSMFSTERMGWTHYSYSVSPDLIYIINTNFAYGSSAYFHINIKYKGIALVAFSYIVKYYYAKIVDIISCTRAYKPSRDNWSEVFRFTCETANQAMHDPDKFVSQWIDNECSQMMDGLRLIAKNPHDVLAKMIDAGVANRKNKIVNNILCVRDISDPEVQIYNSYKDEMTLVFQVSKITGALKFLDNLSSLTQISDKVFSYIEEIKALNKGLLPTIERHIIVLTKELRRKRTILKETKLKIERIKQKNNLFAELEKELEKTYIRDTIISRFLKDHPDFEDIYNQVNNMKAEANKLDVDITRRENFLSQLEEGKLLIERTY